MFYDPYFLLLIPAFILAIYAQIKVQSTYARFSQVPTQKGIPAAVLARKLLDQASLARVEVEPISGNLTDQYDPRAKVLRLSENVYNSSSVAAVGVTAHEVGHALQDAQSYAPLAFRNGLVPAANFGSQLAFPLFFLGLIFSWQPLMDLGIIAFSIAVFFTVLTLPVEFNASSRAIAILRDGQYLTTEELGSAKKVLNAAALTYLAATAMALLQLLRLLALRGQRD